MRVTIMAAALAVATAQTPARVQTSAEDMAAKLGELGVAKK